MKKENLILAGRLWLEGVVLFALRLVHLRTGFDADTGMALPSLAGRAVWIGLLVCLAAEAALCVRRPGNSKRSYACCFRILEGPALGVLTAGCFLLIAGGILLLLPVLPPQGAAEVTAAAAGALGIAGGAGLLLLAKELRSGDAPTVFPLLAAMFFSVLFLLAVYFPEESNPVLERYYLPVLGAAMAAYFLYQLSGLIRGEGNLRWFGLIADFAAVTCVAAAADCLDNPGHLMVYLGFAAVITAFLLLLRKEPLPEPEEAEEDAA